MADLLNAAKSWLLNILSLLLSFLPDSPFAFEGAAEFSEVMGYVNYFIPVSSFLGILTAWLAAIAVYYISLVVLRWVKVIE